MLDTQSQVIWALVTYTDSWQPTTTSLMRFTGSRRRPEHSDGLRAGLLETLEERTETGRRMSRLSDREREILFLWYVAQRPVNEIARAVGVSPRQCFRLRARSIKRVIELGRPDEAA